MHSWKPAFAAALVLTAFIAPAATPPVKSHGLDLPVMNKSIKPGDDFYRYANGAWEKNTAIPPDRSVYGVFTILDEKANKRTSDLIQQADKAKAPAGSETRMIGDYYAAYMDEKAIEARGLKSIQPELDQIAAIGDKPSLAHVLGSERWSPESLSASCQLFAKVSPAPQKQFRVVSREIKCISRKA